MRKGQDINGTLRRLNVSSKPKIRSIWSNCSRRRFRRGPIDVAILWLLTCVYNHTLIFKAIRMSLLAGKRILITGLLSNRSIAYGIAKAMHREGAELAFTCQGEGLRERVAKTVAEFNSNLLFPCDVSNDAEIARCFDDLGKHSDG